MRKKDNHIKKITQEYCDWVKSLGGEHNIDPLTLTSLFSTGYDTKPALSVPINVVQLTNIPAELRPTAYVPPDPNNNEDSANAFNIYEDSIKVIYQEQQLKLTLERRRKNCVSSSSLLLFCFRAKETIIVMEPGICQRRTGVICQAQRN